MLRKSINKSIVKGPKYQTEKGRGILYSSITKPATEKHKHKTENKLIILSRFSERTFLNTKAEIAPIKINPIIITSIGLRLCARI